MDLDHTIYLTKQSRYRAQVARQICDNIQYNGQEVIYNCKTLNPELVLTDYFINMQEIGVGQFGVVVSAETTDNSKELLGIDDLPPKVALKQIVIPAEDKGRQVLHDEIEILKLLDTPRTMKYYGCVDVGASIYIITELLHGKDLFDLIIDGALNNNQKQFIASELAQAIDDIHKVGLAHRDIKPENIMFDPATNTLKLIDFGLSCYYAKNLGNCGAHGGTVAYYDPRVVLRSIDSMMLGDWWAFGHVVVVLYTTISLYNKSKRLGVTPIDMSRYNRLKAIGVSNIAIIPKQFRHILDRLTDVSIPQKSRPGAAMILSTFVLNPIVD